MKTMNGDCRKQKLNPGRQRLGMYGKKKMVSFLLLSYSPFSIKQEPACLASKKNKDV